MTGWAQSLPYSIPPTKPAVPLDIQGKRAGGHAKVARRLAPAASCCCGMIWRALLYDSYCTLFPRWYGSHKCYLFLDRLRVAVPWPVPSVCHAFAVCHKMWPYGTVPSRFRRRESVEKIQM